MASLKKQNKPLADDLKEKKRSMTCLAKTISIFMLSMDIYNMEETYNGLLVNLTNEESFTTLNNMSVLRIK